MFVCVVIVGVKFSHEVKKSCVVHEMRNARATVRAAACFVRMMPVCTYRRCVCVRACACACLMVRVLELDSSGG